MEDAIFESEVAGRQHRHNSIVSQTGVTFIRRGKRLTEIGQIITVTSQIHGGPYYYFSLCAGLAQK